ncbi:cupin domain-containing protein [Haliea sp. E1-2-M8]|uniref:cupin domain-containing protein n=1 Tax=Haliea sp. E1-2-M8 TaxID=3064706 RepID=UPI00271F00CF|nr:cupin domain-containing protein [Haliea sp. E1-2-M8]MDO8863829.1 cupin domain-containing protein [Haliea sp. E1-2-M8]
MLEAKLLTNPLELQQHELTDWGKVAAPIGDPVSHESGVLLFRREDKSSEMGMWQCTPGVWRCDVVKDEFCYFLSGKAIYRPDAGAEFTVTTGVAAAFPAGWSGTCEVLETVRKVYMVR